MKIRYTILVLAVVFAACGGFGRDRDRGGSVDSADESVVTVNTYGYSYGFSSGHMLTVSNDSSYPVTISVNGQDAVIASGSSNSFQWMNNGQSVPYNMTYSPASKVKPGTNTAGSITFVDRAAPVTGGAPTGVRTSNIGQSSYITYIS
ncbi:MAG: hypothetical protein LBC99_11380 [Spirochaetota bacterium]|nr:hypothetical protein [Spirochaetota bacterium]